MPSTHWRIDLKTLALAVIAGLLAFRFHRSLIEVVGVMAALGIAVRICCSVA